ncbi:MAG: sigma-70 family RNA polymerase sigma factor [Pirellulales bacterium]
MAKATFMRQLEAARGGSQEAVGEMLEQCRNYLLAVANRNVQPRIRAEVAPSDLVQETFHTAVRKFDQFHGATEAELHGWLARILWSRYRDVVFRGQRIPPFGSEYSHRLSRPPRSTDDSGSAHWPAGMVAATDETPSAVAIADEESAAVSRAMQRLTSDMHCVIRMRNWEQYSFVEIGQHLNCSADAARKRWTRAIEHLCRELESCDDFRRPGV